MIYEIINPSDPYTLVAEDPATAAAVCLLLGEGRYSLRPVEAHTDDADEHDDVCPIMLLWSGAQFADWWRTRFGGTHDEFWASTDNRRAIATVLESVMIGTAADRARMERALAAISDQAERANARAAWHEERRSSLNDIGARAGYFAEHLRQRLAENTDPAASEAVTRG